MSLQYLRKEFRDEYAFLHADKHQGEYCSSFCKGMEQKYQRS